MNIQQTFTSAVVVAALGLVSVPASAQDQRGNGHQRGGGRATASQPAPQQDRGERAVPRQSPREVAPQQRQSAPRSSESRQYSGAQSVPGQNRAERAVPGQSLRDVAPQMRQGAPRPSDSRQYSASQSAPRAYGNRQDQQYQQYQQRAVPRSYDRPSYQSPAYRNGDSRGYGSSSYRNGYSRGYGSSRDSYRSYQSRPFFYSERYDRPYNYVPYRPFYFSRPYFSFRSHLNLGLGLWLGYSVPYPYAYMGDYRPRVYGYYPEGSLSVNPEGPIYGGISFDIQPADADLFVDGEYVGQIGTFGATSEPLTLRPGEHRIEVQREGFRSMAWDVTIEPGEVIPYRAVMERY